MPFLTHNELRTTSLRISIPCLPPAFEGLRLVQMSDLHFYEHTDPAYYERVARHVNALSSDVIALTGDIVHYGSDHIGAAETFLARLEAQEAKLAVLGNHDYNDGAYGAHVAAMLQATGFHLLVNDAVPLSRGQQTLWFAGLDDLWYGHPDIPRAMAEIPADRDAVILLAHNPLLFDPVALSSHGRVDLVLAGHTHAGHVFLPFLLLIYRWIFRMKYRYGLYQKKDSLLYVTSGVGSAAFYLKKQRVGFPRFRFNTWPEIVLLTLTRHPT